MLRYYWKRWAQFYVSPLALRTASDLKLVCEAAVSQILNFPAQMVNITQEFSARMEITAVDFCEDVLLCGKHIRVELIALMLKKKRKRFFRTYIMLEAHLEPYLHSKT